MNKAWWIGGISAIPAHGKRTRPSLDAVAAAWGVYDPSIKDSRRNVSGSCRMGRRKSMVVKRKRQAVKAVKKAEKMTPWSVSVIWNGTLYQESFLVRGSNNAAVKARETWPGCEILSVESDLLTY